MSHDLDHTKLLAFLRDYEALCRRHGLYITANLYDMLQVWPLSMALDENPFERMESEYLTLILPVTPPAPPRPAE